MTRSVAAHTRRADAVLVAVGVPGLLTADMIKPGAAVIDIGINQITDSDGTSRIVGDADTMRWPTSPAGQRRCRGVLAR